MNNDTINALIALDEDVDTPVVEAALPPGGKIVLAGLIEGLGNADGALDDHAADVLVVACGGASTAAVDLVREVSSKRREPPVIAFCETPPDYFVHALFDAGADDVVKLPETPERVLFAFQKAIARGRGRDAARPTAKAPMICVLGPKGGTGKTVASSNLAVGLAAAGNRSVVVDLDLQFGDIGLALGLSPQRTVYDLASSGGALDGEKLDAYLATHSSKARALLAPTRPDQAGEVSTELLREVYDLLRASYNHVIVDTPPDFTPTVIAAIDASSHVCMVTAMDSLSLKNTKLGLETLELMGYDPTAITVVLNRADSQVGIAHADVEQIIGRKPDVLVPSNRAVPRSLNEGVPILLGDARSPVSGALRQLAAVYMPDTAGTNGHRRRGLRLRRARRARAA
jgi:pilus assembly protein CpaE